MTMSEATNDAASALCELPPTRRLYFWLGVPQGTARRKRGNRASTAGQTLRWLMQTTIDRQPRNMRRPGGGFYHTAPALVSATGDYPRLPWRRDQFSRMQVS